MASSEPEPALLAIRGPLARADLPGLYDRVCALLASSPATVAICDVAGIAADAVALDALARLQLAARRRGCRIRLREASSELLELIALAGLGEALPCDSTDRAAAGGRTAGRASPCRERT